MAGEVPPLVPTTGEGPDATRPDATSDELARRFNQAMHNVYVHAKQEVGYNATYYFQMLHQHGALETARRLLASNTVSDGFTALWKLQRLDLTVENTVLQPEFHVFFTEDELGVARRRLTDYGFSPGS